MNNGIFYMDKRILRLINSFLYIYKKKKQKKFFIFLFNVNNRYHYNNIIYCI